MVSPGEKHLGVIITVLVQKFQEEALQFVQPQAV